MDIATTPALIFFALTLPFCLYVAWTDLTSLKIYNKTVLLLAAVFVMVAPFLLPWQDIAWQVGIAVFALVIGFVMTILGLFGAGDAKFVASASLFIHASDWMALGLIFILVSFTALIVHRVAKMLGAGKLVPHWASFEQSKHFPYGIALAPTLSIYLGLGAFGG